MNDHLFAMLLSLFEQTLSQMKQQQKALELALDQDTGLFAKTDDFNGLTDFNLPSKNAIRVITRLEQSKLTKPALQFLMRLMHTGMLSSEQFEHVMNLVMDSNMRFVSVEEVKFIIHQVLSESLSHKEILMLEFAYDVETSPVTMH
jgi:uncharacterized protein Smg (DUF494 family)